MKKTLFVLITMIFFLVTTAFTKVSNDFHKTRKIFLDPGHGGIDGGTSFGDIFEKDINLSFCFVLKETLENEGYKVFMTRDGDYDLASEMSKNRKRDDIKKRVDLINSSFCDIYLTIHTNNFSDEKIYGAQTFYNGNNIDSKNLAKAIQSSFQNNLENNKREALPIKEKYLIDNTLKVGCLIEIGFLSNKEELALLKSEGYKKVLSEAISLGIEKYFNSF